MEEQPTRRLHLDVTRRGGTLSGVVGVAGQPVRRFTGWIALNAAIDDLLGDDGASDLDARMRGAALDRERCIGDAEHPL